ncbi:MAG: methyltransferase domain-containing protein [Halobacteriota archaeon]
MQNETKIRRIVFDYHDGTVGKLRTDQPNYGNWVSVRILYALGVLAILLLGVSFVFPLIIVGAIASLVAFGYFMYARYRFSLRGGDLQAQIRELVLHSVEWNGEGRALDIGCGNAALTINMAKRFPTARVTGIDYWGGKWEYSRAVCEHNATIEGVADRVKFQKASASALPFEVGSFDAAVSNLVFHEVSDAKDKRDLIEEALRVVRKGGAFAFQDLFLAKRLYGDVEELLEVIRSWGIESVELLDTAHSDAIPKALRLPFMLGTIAILYGKK